MKLFPKFARIMETEHGQVLLSRDVDEQGREGVETLFISAFAKDVARLDMKIAGLPEAMVAQIIDGADEARTAELMKGYVEKLVGGAEAMTAEEEE